MTGYQEVLTDPSYSGQIVTMTCPEIGNYGVSADDVESRRPQVAGFIVRDESPVASNWRAEGTLRDYLVGQRHRRHCRHRHARADAAAALGRRDARRHRHRRRPRSGGARRSRQRRFRRWKGRTWCAGSPREQPFDWPAEDPDEFGIAPEQRADAPAEDRRLRLRDEVEHPAAAERARLRRARLSRRRRRPSELLATNPDGVFLSNGPGDPAPLTYAIENAKALVDANVPVFGICLGHQILGLAMGGIDLQAEVRPSRRQPSGEEAGDRQDRDHLAEPRLRRRSGVAAGRRRGDAPQPLRRDGRRSAASRRIRCSRCSIIRKRRPGRTTPTICSTTSSN